MKVSSYFRSNLFSLLICALSIFANLVVLNVSVFTCVCRVSDSLLRILLSYSTKYRAISTGGVSFSGLLRICGPISMITFFISIVAMDAIFAYVGG